MHVEEVSARVVDAAFQIHRALGPGLLESVYEMVLARKLAASGLRVERQKPVGFEFDGIHFEKGFRVDLLVEGCLVVEVKSSEHVAPVHGKQVLTYLRLLNLSLGLLINFGTATFKAGVKRVVNGHTDLAFSRLRVNRPAPPLPHERVERQREGPVSLGPVLGPDPDQHDPPLTQVDGEHGRLLGDHRLADQPAALE